MTTSTRLKNRLARYFDTSRFAPAPAYQFINLARTLPDTLGPRLHNWDLSVIKDTRIGGRVRFQLRGEAFNAWNQPSFSNPGTSFGTVAFGRINAVANLANPARQIHLAGRLAWWQPSGRRNPFRSGDCRPYIDVSEAPWAHAAARRSKVGCRKMEVEQNMSKRELIAREVGKLSDQDLDRLLAFIRALSEEHAEASAPALAAESALSKDWLSPEEDAAWADL